MNHEFQEALCAKACQGQIDYEAFVSYYADVSATLPSQKEEYFVDLVVNTWALTSSTNYVSAERLDQLTQTLYEKVRQKTLVKEDEAKSLGKAFRYFDLHDKGVVNQAQFKQTLEKFGCSFKESELQALFDQHSTAGNGLLAYDEFCNMFATMGSGNNPNVNPVFNLARTLP